MLSSLIRGERHGVRCRRRCWLTLAGLYRVSLRSQSFHKLFISKRLPGVSRAPQSYYLRLVISLGQQFCPCLHPARLAPKPHVGNPPRVLPGEVRLGARPLVLAWRCHQPRSHRIHFHISQRRPQVRRTEHTGIKAVLPKMPAAAPPCIQVLRIAAMYALYDLTQRDGALLHRNQVDVVAHQTLSEDRHVAERSLLA